jgi:uncharacterized protein involved in copper resistance
MLLIVLIPLLLIGCVQQASQPPLAANDPANPRAPEAPLPERSRALAVAGAAPSATDAVVPPQQLMPDMKHNMPGMSHGMEHDMGDMKGMQHQAPATVPGQNAALSAPRWTPTTAPSTGPSTSATVYTCRMHPQILSNAPGKCPICGMKLVPKSSIQEPAHDHTGHGDKGELP